MSKADELLREIQQELVTETGYDSAIWRFRQAMESNNPVLRGAAKELEAQVTHGDPLKSYESALKLRKPSGGKADPNLFPSEIPDELEYLPWWAGHDRACYGSFPNSNDISEYGYDVRFPSF